MGNYIYHSGTKGMKWYQRLYQYPDGSLTPLGRVHYGVGPPRGSRNSTPSESSGKNSKSSDFQDEPPKRRTFRELNPEEQHEVMQDALERIRAKDSSVYGDFTVDDIKAIIDRAEQEAKLEQRANPQQQTQNSGNNGITSVSGKTTIDGKPLSEMSDQELKERLQRLNSEAQYKKLMNEKKPPSAMDRLKQALGLVKVGKDVAGAVDDIQKIKDEIDSRLHPKPAPPKTFKDMSPEQQRSVMNDVIDRIHNGDDSVYNKYSTDELRSIMDRFEQESRFSSRFGSSGQQTNSEPQRQNTGNSGSQQPSSNASEVIRETVQTATAVNALRNTARAAYGNGPVAALPPASNPGTNALSTILKVAVPVALVGAGVATLSHVSSKSLIKYADKVKTVMPMNAASYVGSFVKNNNTKAFTEAGQLVTKVAKATIASDIAALRGGRFGHF